MILKLNCFATMVALVAPICLSSARPTDVGHQVQMVENRIALFEYEASNLQHQASATTASPALSNQQSGRTKTETSQSGAPQTTTFLCKGISCGFQRAVLRPARDYLDDQESFSTKLEKQKLLGDLDDQYELMHGFDHLDFVVSDLEFDLVLRRLRAEFCKDSKQQDCDRANEDDESGEEFKNNQQQQAAGSISDLLPDNN